MVISPATELIATLQPLCEEVLPSLPHLTTVIEKCAQHFQLMLKWNEKISLTTITAPAKAAQFHYLESLFASQLVNKEITTAIDIGTGAGFPGLPLAISLPEIKFTLLEADRRKVAFLKEAKRQLQLPNLEILHQRFQDTTCQYQLVTVRALERLDDQREKLWQFAATAKELLCFLSKESAHQWQAEIKHRGEESLWQSCIFPLPQTSQRTILQISRQ